MNNFEKEYQKYFEYFNEYLEEKFNKLDKSSPSLIKDAMAYAIKDGGKRVRPILCFFTAKALGLSIDCVKDFALAVELIHAYSLVHDDLPAMDNDDFRRGKLSTHKKFGEAYGILTGDALLNFAFETALSKPNFNSNDLEALRLLASFSGYSGMIAGQVLDLKSENCLEVDSNLLYDIYLNKTAKLIMAPILIASTVAGKVNYDNLYEYGYNLGVTFQIVDDILDEEGDFYELGKSLHKDKESGKLTAVKVFGLEKAKIKAKEHYDKCVNAILNMENNELLLDFARKMFERKK